MRTAFAAAAFAAGALAVPAHRHMHKRDIVVDYDYVTVTDIVTVTAGAPPASTSSAVEVVNNSPSTSSRSHHHWWTWGTSTPVATSTAAPSTTEAPSSAVPTSAEPTSEAPAPSSEAPAPSSYQAPSSSEAPATSAAPSTWATSTKAAPTTAAPTSSADSSLPSTYSAIAVKHHNLHRSNHSSPDIEWDDALANTAKTIANSCVYAHNVDQDKDSIGGYGQNIAAGVDAANISAIITDLFYNGEVGWYDGLYGQAQPDMTNFEHWGHFSQIVWKSTTKVGCATTVCDQLANVGSGVSPVFTVCNYQPPGNYANEYGTNVGKPLGGSTAQWNTDLPDGYGS